MSGPRAPVLVGTGQVTHRPEDGEPPSPLELMERAARLAADDAGNGGEALLARAESVAAVDSLSWPVPDPAAALAEALGLAPAETVRSARAGTAPLELLGDLGARIQAGELDVALVAGAEAVSALMAAMREERDPGWPSQPEGTRAGRQVGSDRDASHPAELAAGLIAPVAYYPLIEHAVRSGAGAGRAEHQEWLGELWGRFAAVAASNPHAWSRDPPEAAAIARPGPGNRRVADPYTKLLTANIQVDQGAALILCSARMAEAAGVPRDRHVFLHATAAGHDRWFMSERDRLDRSPAIEACGRAVLGHAGIAIDDVAHLDLYSCFPSAVQIAARELGIDLRTDTRPPTVTGGLTFAGGPGSNYVTHSLAAMCAALREDPGSYGIATGVGWYMTKHAAGVLSAIPPARPFAHAGVQPEVDALSGREVAGAGDRASAAAEAFTTLYERGGSPSVGIVTALLEDGRRAVAKAEDPDTLAALEEDDPLGRPVELAADGSFRLSRPARARRPR